MCSNAQKIEKWFSYFSEINRYGFEGDTRFRSICLFGSYFDGFIIDENITERDEKCRKVFDSLGKAKLTYLPYCRPYFYSTRQYNIVRRLVTDHKPLLWFRNCKDGKGVAMEIETYKICGIHGICVLYVVYEVGKINVKNDTLSRNLVDVTEVDDTDEIFATQHQKKKNRPKRKS